MDVRDFNVVIVGGSGFWTEINHIPNLLTIKSKIPSLKVVGICDIQDPYVMPAETRANLHSLLETDKPDWVKVNHLDEVNLEDLSRLHSAKPINLMIIACSPTVHFDYAMWALQNGVSVVCDKPLIDVADAASDPVAARQIYTNYETLIAEYAKAKQKDPYLSFSLILRRRALPAFTAVSDRLLAVSEKYGAGINHLNILNHNGIYKYPEEMQGEGAHDFSAGVGALSHSSYHYIDLFNRYLASAKGEIAYMIPRLTNVFRISDYLDAESYASLHALNEHKPVDKKLKLPANVLACELDFAFNMTFYRADGQRIGDGNFISNHVSFSPRTRDFEPGITEPAQYPDGGRTSHLYVDVHQSGLQNLQIIKNDVAFQGPSIIFRSRTHPAIEDLADLETVHFDDAYNKTEHHLKDMLELVVNSIIERRKLDSELVIDVTEDAQNMRVFAKFYELIAREYAKESPGAPLQDAIPVS